MIETKIGFSKKEERKDDITRDRDPNPTGLLAGLALTAVMLGGLAAASLKISEKFQKNKEE